MHHDQYDNMHHFWNMHHAQSDRVCSMHYSTASLQVRPDWRGLTALQDLQHTDTVSPRFHAVRQPNKEMEFQTKDSTGGNDCAQSSALH